MQTPFNDEIDYVLKVATAILQLGVVMGGACVIAYSLRIGRYPQGLTVGDGILFLMAAGCFASIWALFVGSLIAVGMCASPLLRLGCAVMTKVWSRFGKRAKPPVYDLAPFHWYAVPLAIIGIEFIYLLSRRDAWAVVILPLLSISLYLFYSVFISANAQLVKLEKLRRGALRASSHVDVVPANKQSKLENMRTAGAVVVVTATIGLSGQMGQLLDSAMRGAHVRIEHARLHIKAPYSHLVPAKLAVDTVRTPPSYMTFERIVVLSNGFGTTTAVQFQDDGLTRTLDIPNDAIIVEQL